MVLEDALKTYKPRTFEELEAEVTERGDKLAKELIGKTFPEAYLHLGVATHVYDSENNLVLTLDEKFGNHVIRDKEDGWAAIQAASAMMSDSVLCDHDGNKTILPICEAYEKKPERWYHKVRKGIMWILTGASLVGLVALAGCTDDGDDGDGDGGNGGDGICSNYIKDSDLEDLWKDTNGDGYLDHSDYYKAGDVICVKGYVMSEGIGYNASSGKTGITTVEGGTYWVHGNHVKEIGENTWVYLTMPIIKTTNPSGEEAEIPDWQDTLGKNTVKKVEE